MEYYLVNPENYRKGIKDFACSLLKGIQETTYFSRLFFSQKNIDEIQKQIRYHVYSKTKEIISNQEQTSLMLEMRDIYLVYHAFPKCNVRTEKGRKQYTEEISKLNNLTVNSAVDKIITSLLQYKKYLIDIEKIQIIEEDPIATSEKASRSLEFSHPLVTEEEFFS